MKSLYLQIFLNLSDGFFTKLHIEKYGIGIEANPIMKFMINNFGIYNGLFVPKIIFLSLLIFIYLKDKKKFINSLLYLNIIFGIVFVYHILLWMEVI